MQKSITIKNFRGIAEATVTLSSPLTIISGDNGDGKTSFAQALALGLTGEIPLSNARKDDLKMFIREAATESTVKVYDNDGEITHDLLTGKRFTIGINTQASVFSCGVKSPCEMSERAASDFWIEHLDAMPTKDELQTALPDVDIKDIWLKIEAIGWDGAFKDFQEKGARCKGAWEQITGEKYGVKKAETWLPPKWLDGLYGQTVEQLQEKIKEAEENHSKAIAKKAVETHIEQSLEIKAAQEPALKKKFDELVEKISKFPSKPMKCPHCKKAVTMQTGKLVAAVEITSAQEAEQEKMRSERDAVFTEYRAASQAKHELAQQKKAQAATLAQVSGTEASPDEIQAATLALEKACADLATKQAYIDTKAKHAEILKTAKIVRELAPEGLRAMKLSKALKSLNEQLAIASELAGWGSVEVLSDMSTRYDGRHYKVLSESEQYRCRAIVQVIIAKKKNDKILIFDRAELLTKKNRNGLVNLCFSAEVLSVMLFSSYDKKEVPVLPDGQGASYWVSKGTFELLK